MVRSIVLDASNEVVIVATSLIGSVLVVVSFQ